MSRDRFLFDGNNFSPPSAVGSGTVTSVGLAITGATDLFSVSGSPVSTYGDLTLDAVTAGSDKIVFWDQSAAKLTYMSVGSGLTITGTVLSATGAVSPEFADNVFRITGNVDATKKAAFEVDGFTTGTTRTFILPNADTSIVGTDTTQTLTNKTLTSPTITVRDNAFTLQDNADPTKQLLIQVSAVSTGTTRTLTAPDADTTIVGTDTTQTLTNKTLTSPTINTPVLTVLDSQLTIQDNGDPTKQLRIQVSALTTGTTRTLTAPDANTIIVGTDTAQTLTNKTLSPTGNVISIFDQGNFTLNDGSGSGTTLNFDLSNVTPANSILALIPDINGSNWIVFDSAVQTLTNKTVIDNSFTIQDNSVSTKQARFDVSNLTANQLRTYTFPDATTLLVGSDTTQTLTNKTLSSPTINTPVLTVLDSQLTIQDNADPTKQLQLQLSGLTSGTTRTLTAPDANTTIVGTDTAQVLTNKRVLDDSFTIEVYTGDGTTLKFDLGTLVDPGNTIVAQIPNITGSQELVFNAATQTLTNKTLTSPTITVRDNAFTIEDDADPTKKIQFQVSGVTTGQTRVLTVPDANATIVGAATTQTLTNKTISGTTNTISVQDDKFSIVGSTPSRILQFNPDTIGAAITVTWSVANLSGEVTVQGNTFNGINQLVQTNGSGKIPASTVSSTNGGIVFRNSSGNLTDTRTSVDAVEMGDSGYFWHKGASYLASGISGSTPSYFTVNGGSNPDSWTCTMGININITGTSATQIGNSTGNTTINGATTTLGCTTLKINFGSDATGDTYYRNSSGNTVRLPIGQEGQSLAVSGGLPVWRNPSELWEVITSTSANAEANKGYITNNAALVTITLPTSIAVGQKVRVSGLGAGGWKIAQNSGQSIHLGASTTTTGTGGYLQNSAQYDCIELLCVVANTTFVALSNIGTITVV